MVRLRSVGQIQIAWGSIADRFFICQEGKVKKLERKGFFLIPARQVREGSRRKNQTIKEY
jgi:hypothetical protein